MKKLNKKGFTLIEVLAVVIILSALMAIMIPSAGTIINKNKEDNYKKLEQSIKKAARIYLSDHRYEIGFTTTCTSPTDELEISIPATQTLEKSKISLKTLVNDGPLTTDKNGAITDPRDKTKEFNLDTSYVLYKYSCQKKDFIYKSISLNE